MLIKKMKLISLVLLLLGVSPSMLYADEQVDLKSPDGKIRVSFNIADKIYYSISCNGDNLLENCYLQMNVNNQLWGQNPKLASKKITAVSEKIEPVVPLKFSTVDSRYNKLLLTFKGGYSVEFRAFDDGVAYRFISNKKGVINVNGEDFAIKFPDNYLLHMQQPGSFKTAYEEEYSHLDIDKWEDKNRMALLPVLIDTKKQYKILISEADLSDYPCMFLKTKGNRDLYSIFPKAPIEFGEDGDRSLKILKEADYIARTDGRRSFPWRYFVVAQDDGRLIENTMTLKLSSPSKLAETSWIQPGQVSWEWWNDASPYGEDVNFVAGYNLDTYKYYIDFASKYGIKYIIMDEGWALKTQDPYTPNPKVDVHELIRYGKEKNVGIILWLTWLALENNFEAFKTFEEWGVKGLKIDFMDRSDQWMVNYYKRVAAEAAKHHLLVDFHGSFKPAGLEYEYPNVISYEGVRGLEQGGNCRPENTIYLPFLRNAVGPMDFTPGAMINMQPNVYSARRPNNAGMGTRANQMAMFVVFESALQMLADNPTMYYKNSQCTEFITQVPTTWDETIALDAKVGEYIVVAKRKGDKWFIGAMTNNTGREFDLDLSFLNKDRTYEMTSFEDGINADRQAMDYRKKVSQVNAGEKLKIKLARNGGWTAVLK